MKRTLAATVALLALFSGCKKDEPADLTLAPFEEVKAGEATPAVTPKHDPEEIAVTVGDFKMSWGDIDKRVDAVIKQYAGQLPPEQNDKLPQIREMFVKRLVQSVIVQQALLQAATAAGAKLEQADRDAQMNKLEEFAKMRGTTVKEILAKAPLGPDAARKELEEGWLIEKYIKTTIPQFKADEKALDEEIAQAKKLVQEKTALAESLLKQVKEGADFAKLAEENSDCPSGKQNKGSLGKFKRGQMVKPFEDAVIALAKPGDITTNLVKTAFGLHIIRLDAKNPAKPAEGDKPAEDESFEASHILVRIPEVPTKEALAEMQKETFEGKEIRKLIDSLIKKLEQEKKIATPFDEEIKAARQAAEKAAQAAECADGCTDHPAQEPAPKADK